MYRICFVTTISLTLKTFVLDFAKHLHKTGDFDICFVCDHDEEFANSLPDYIRYHPISMRRGISPGGVRATLEMYRFFKKEKFDIVQYSTPNASCYAALASKMANIPHRLYCQWGIAYVGFSGLKRRIFKLVEKLVCNCSTDIEPDSLGNLEFSRSQGLYGPQKSRVIHNGSASGVNLKKFDISRKGLWREEKRKALSIPDQATVFIFIGRITRDKGINELFVAARSLMEKKKDVYLLLVGSMEKSESADPELYNWSLGEQRVIYAGYTNEVEKYLAASDIYLLPSYREGFGSAVVEAEAMGLPVIVSDIPGPTNAMINEKTGLLTPKADAGLLYKNMLFLYENRHICAEYGKQGEEFARTCFEQTELFEKMYNDRLWILEHSHKTHKRKDSI